MKGILEFNLDDKVDEEAYMRCVKATKLALALYDMDQYLRLAIKHAPDSMSTEIYGGLKNTRDELHKIMSHHLINLDELLS
jgi:hypothetical protein